MTWFRLAFNQMKALIVTAPAELRETLVGLTAGALIKLCKNFRPGRPDDPTAAAKYTLRSLARRYRQLSNEIHDLEGELERLTRAISPALVDSYGIGPDTAATLLVAAGSNPERLDSEASFASLCGVNPIPRYPQARPIGIGSIAAVIVRQTLLSIASLWSDFGMIRGPSPTCDGAPWRG